MKIRNAFRKMLPQVRRLIRCFQVAVFLFPDEWRVAVQVAAQVAGQQLGLQKREKADGGGFAGEAVLQGVAFAFLPGDEDGFAGGFFEYSKAK